MKIFELKKDGVYGIGFIDPNTVNEHMLINHKQDTENNLLMFLKKLNTRPEILFPYNFRRAFIVLYYKFYFCLLDVKCVVECTMHARLYKRVRWYHWILLIIRVNEETVEVLDSQNKDSSEYKNMYFMLDR